MTLLPLMLLCAAPSVSGSVVDTAGDPVAGATVELREKLVFHGPDRLKNIVRTSTDAAGRFTATVDFSAKIARAEASGYAQTGAYYAEEWVRIPESGPVTLTLRKQRTDKVTGSVVDEANAPLAGAMVSPANGNRESSTFTDASGAFSLTMPSGELEIYRKGYVRQKLAPTAAPMKIVMRKLPTIAVYLFDAKGQPMQDIETVDALRPDGTRISSCNTRPALGDCTLEAELGDVTVTATVGGKTVKQVVRLEGTKKVDASLKF